MIPYVLCQVGETAYAIPAEHVEQLEMIEEVTRVPDSPPFLEGIVYLRGKVVPVVNLRLRFGLPRQDFELSSRLIVVRQDQRWVGLAVDSARDYKLFPEAALEPAPDHLTADFLLGVIHHEKKLILVLDVPRLLETTKLADRSN